MAGSTAEDFAVSRNLRRVGLVTVFKNARAAANGILHRRDDFVSRSLSTELRGLQDGG
jgi:hypothetical protein